MKIAKLIIAVLVLLAVLAASYWYFIVRKQDETVTTVPSVVKPKVTHAAPIIDVIHQRQGNEVEVFWHIDADPLLEHVTLNAWREGWRYKSRPYTPGEEFLLESEPKEVGKTYFYYVETSFKDGTTSRSADKTLRFTQAPAVVAPTTFNAKWVNVQDIAYVQLAWNHTDNINSSMLRGYALYIGDFTHSRLVPLTQSMLFSKESRYLARMRNTDSSQCRFAIASIGQHGNQSERIEQLITCPRAVLPMPVKLEVQTPVDGNMSLSWDYPTVKGIKGFRLYNNDIVLADENDITNDLRSWSARLLALTSGGLSKTAEPYQPDDEISYNLQLAAVAEEGIISPLSEKVTVSVKVKNHPVNVPEPVNFVASWVSDNGQLAATANWSSGWPDGAISAYKLEQIAADGTTSVIKELTLPEPVNFVPSGDSRSVKLRLTAVGVDGMTTRSIETSLPDPAALLPVARLLDYRLIQEGGEEYIEWRWRYPDIPILKGFRIYQDSKKVADESTLGNKARVWRSTPTNSQNTMRFEIEAVGQGNVISARGPAQYVLAEPPVLQ